MKKALLLLVLVIALGGIVSAQEAHKNVIYAGTTDIFGIFVGYERMFRPNFSFLIDAGGALFPNFARYVSAHLRWFPFSSYEGVGFFLDTGIGFGEFRRIHNWLALIYGGEEVHRITGLILSPGLGVKFGAGKRRGLVFAPSLNFDIYLGRKEQFLGENRSDALDDYDYLWGESKSGVGVNPNLKLLFGFAF